MTLFDADRPPWKQFQTRIEFAVFRAADEHESTRDLLTDLEMCEMFLRDPHLSLEEFQSMGSPIASELCDALDDHAVEGIVQYDEICTANVVLAVMNAITQASDGD